MSEPKKYCLEHTIMVQTTDKETAKTSYYGVSFNRYDPHDNNIFAVVGGRNVIIARLDSDKPVALKVVQTYVDDDEGENFYCCAWSVDPNIGAPLLAVAGATSNIKIINTSVGSAMKALTGHGNDVHLTGDFLASSGMDCAVKIWTLCTPVIKHAIGSSINSNPSSSHSQQLSQREQQSCCSPHVAPSRAVTVHYPIFSTTELHNNFIDCVRWYGDLLLSRCAADAKIVLWKPDVELVAFDKSNITTVVVGGPATPSKQQANFDIICELEFTHSDIWFIRFGFSYDFRMLATGNQVGKIYLWDTKDIPYYIDGYIEKKKAEYLVKKYSVKRKRGTRVSKSAVIKKPIILESDCKSTIRQIDFSKNSQWIVSVCDDGSIWCWKSNIDTTFQESIKGSGSSDDPLIID
ncbi:WD40 repeat-like protein [Rhizophagus irregularis]|uniref:WD40 repeat-like protein n=1 Tax=Rhizophagus irregularis TaxID=588596 RepID=A0A2N0S820_9GLOM|nr:WD40 repeat-like protein [Rhizophagus irregularis]